MTEVGTISCPSCGAENALDDDFCGACGEYLGWEARGASAGAEAAADEPPSVTETIAPPAAETAVVTEVPQATHEPARKPERKQKPKPEPAVRQTEQADAPEPMPEPEPAAIPASEAAPTPPRGATAEPIVAPSEPVASPVAPAVAPPPVQPAARKPQEAAARHPRPRRARPEDAPRPGETVCPNCGAGNAPERHFCRRCAAPLDDAALPVLAESSQPEAGARPLVKTRRFRPGWLVLAVVLLALGGLAWLGRAWIGESTAMLIDRVAAATPVSPVSITASSEAEGRPAASAYDGYSNTSWAPAPTGAAAGEYLEVAFDEPFRLVSMQMIPGASEVPADFLADGRPDTVLVTVTTADGDTVERTVAVADDPGSQSWEFGIDAVTGIRLTLATAHGANEATHVAIAELAFRGR
ncbi:NADase-type glycan-binding domain-containing protein [Agromyces soli]